MGEVLADDRKGERSLLISHETYLWKNEDFFLPYGRGIDTNSESFQLFLFQVKKSNETCSPAYILLFGVAWLTLSLERKLVIPVSSF